MDSLTFKSTALLIGLSGISSVAIAELTTDRAVVGNSELDKITANAVFNSPVAGDLYIATQVGEQLLFIINEGSAFSFEALPFKEDDVYSGSMPVLNLSTYGIVPGNYPVYKLVVTSGADPYHVLNWVSGFSSLSVINFSIGQTTEESGDYDQDGFADDDYDHNGFRDDYGEEEEETNDDQDDDNHSGQDGENTDDDLTDEEDSEDIDDTEKDKPEDSEGEEEEEDDLGGEEPGAIVNENGRQLYNADCSGCHGANPKDDKNNIHKAVDPVEIRDAINANAGGMRVLNFLNDDHLRDIADYVRNPEL